MKKPQSISDYCKWTLGTLSIDCGSKLETYYETVTKKLRDDFIQSDFWTNLQTQFTEFDQEYQVATGYPLFAMIGKPSDMLIKPFASFLEKTYRKNIILNENWPSQPPGGWLSPYKCFDRINDIIRTTYVVKYLDGVDFLFTKIGSLASKLRLKIKTDYEARDEGYYAGHVNVMMPFSIPRQDWDTDLVTVAAEIQITTQLQEVIRRLLHKHYETRRVSHLEPPKKWQWEYRSEAFAANYLGHILHYIEGTILEVRDKQKLEI